MSQCYNIAVLNIFKPQYYLHVLKMFKDYLTTQQFFFIVKNVYVT